MFYFAYGSNLDLMQMQLKCPDAQFVSTARLDGYKICFPRKSFVRDCAIISIEPQEGESVWGALYEIEDRDLKRLDEREGYNPRRDREKNTRTRQTVQVETSDERSVAAEVYIAVPGENPGLPTPQYIGYLVASAAECGLPKSHMVKLAGHIPVTSPLPPPPELPPQQVAA
jgi:gamma-glutamylcyclotransferase